MSQAASNNFIDNSEDDDDDGGFEPYTPPADRFLTAQIWWIASELVRRHPHLLIAGVEVDEHDRLVIVHDEQNGISIQWDLVGGCKYKYNDEVTSISWIEMMAATSPHETVKRIEIGVGLGVPQTTPASIPRALAYRVIASALATTVDDRHDWYAVPAPMTHEEDPDDPDDGCPYFRDFPTARAARAEYAERTFIQLAVNERVWFFQPFWAIIRNLEPVAIVDYAGVIHTQAGATELLPAYEELGRHLALTTVRVLGFFMN